MTKKVYLEPIWKLHAFSHQLVTFPPPGYEFVSNNESQEKLFNFVSRGGVAPFLLKSANLAIPTGLVKSWLERWRKPPEIAEFTYACDHLVFRPEPWVVEVEYASLLLGIHPKHLKRYKGIMERALTSSNCRRIICWSEAGRQSLINDLDSSGFEEKIEVVHASVPPRSFTKKYNSEKVKLLFVGSGTSKGWFERKGGREAIAAFALVRQQHDNLEMVVRSDIPVDFKTRYGGMDGLKIIEEMVPREELERELLTADIYIMPSYNTSPMIMLDAMSYELPVITIDVWANAEYVEDGKTGLVALGSKKLPHYYKDTCQPNWGTAEFEKAKKTLDTDVSNDLASKINILVENPELRRRLGKAARREVESGKFSLDKMRERLERIFDEAIVGED